MSKDLSIIIPAYNVESYIGRCLSSIYQSTSDESSFEVLVIDDGSTDNTLLVANELSTSHTNMRVIQKSNGGVSTARNMGIEESIGKYIMFVDADDWLVGGVSQLISMIDSNMNADVIVGRCFLEGKTFEFCKWSFETEGKYNGCDLFFNHGYSRGTVWGALYSRALLIEHDIRFPLGITHGEDTFVSLLIQMYANRYAFVNKHIYTVFERQGSACRTHNEERVYRYKNNLKQISDFIYNRYGLSNHQLAMLNYALFNVICQAILQYIRLGKYNPWKLKRELNIREYLPIRNYFLLDKLHSRKILILNTSFTIFFLLYGLHLKVTKKT